ncbi:hypothetical protein J8F10_08870 [Gemmata sp. G18]|uniref:Uncharacterized protein n=1 Tax=Gemmata palustris TaxID=2822762 RepID=A0ABS5BP15_9BACT|nr:hypothetical protein [Gemmata palustris]MBP3955391.1 hypothetical protein [Gemmata palustris]
MTGFEAARPRHTLPFAGTDYNLVGTLEMVEAVEAAFRESILQVASRVMSMGLNDTAKLVATLLTTAGYPTKTRDVADHIFTALGVHSPAFDALRMHLYAFLRVTLEPPELREAMAIKMGELLGKLP